MDVVDSEDEEALGEILGDLNLKGADDVFPDEFSDGEIMTTTRNYFRKKVLAQGYIGENGNFLLAESPRAWST